MPRSTASVNMAVCALVGALMIACVDGSVSPTAYLQSTRPLFSSQAGGMSLTIAGQTVGPKGQIWMQTKGRKFLRADSIAVDTVGGIKIVRIDVYKVESQFSAPDSKPFMGGWIRAFATDGQRVKGLTPGIDANIEKQPRIVEIPNGWQAFMRADIKQGCTFEGWSESLHSFNYVSTAATYYPSPSASVAFGVFMCGGSDGSDDPPPGDDGGCPPPAVICDDD